MSNILSYKGYRASVEFDAEDGLLVGRVMGVQDSLFFHGFTTVEIIQSFHDCIDGYLEMCVKSGKEPGKEC